MFAREGYSSIILTIIVACLLCAAAYFLQNWFSYVMYVGAGLLTIWIFIFFRDPDRDIPGDDSLILSPADGKIVLVKGTDEKQYIKGKVTQISIFLSILDVHVNRVPASGKLEYLKYHPGQYLMAWNHQASELNERADFGVLHPTGLKIFYRQITGFLARRIVYHIKEGDQLKAGQRFGMMKFGSRMDILIPNEMELNIEEGQHAVAGETILARIKSVNPDYSQ